MSAAPRNSVRLGDYLPQETQERSTRESASLNQRSVFGVYSMDTGASESIGAEAGTSADEQQRQIRFIARQAAAQSAPVQSYASAPLASGISMGRPIERAAPAVRLGAGRGNIVHASRSQTGGVFNFNRPDAYANDEQWGSDLSIIGNAN